MTRSLSTRAFRASKRKSRPRTSVTESSGGSSGAVLPLELLQDSYYQGVYTIPVLVGSKQQNLSLQVDTGSSDLWIASSSCSTSSCHDADGHVYDPSSSIPSNETFSITYASGEVSGPIVWDSIQLGGYNITNQALAAASTVNSEPLEDDFDGILGLALPQDSIISDTIPIDPVNGLTGAALTYNLFSSDDGPSAPFYSLALERPGSDAVPSVLGIGRHPDGLVSDPSKIQYAGTVTSRVGVQFWEASIRAITVYVDGEARPVSLSSYAYPTAVLDSGTAVILASPNIANGIYGAIGVSPSEDGSYYVPCTTPLNMTITLDDRSELPLHPLDLTYATESDTSTCLGLIQNIAELDSPLNLPDMILGVPFLRNTYTVMAYEAPNNNGKFASGAWGAEGHQVNPYLGLLGLTNITLALEEFNAVRVLHEPLSSVGDNSTTKNSTSKATMGSKHLSVGVDVLLGIMGFIVFCVVLFGARWAYYRRKWRGRPPMLDDGVLPDKDESFDPDELSSEEIACALAPYASPTQPNRDRYSGSEQTLRNSYYAYAHFSDTPPRKEIHSHYTDDTAVMRAEHEAAYAPVKTKEETHDVSSETEAELAPVADSSAGSSWDSFFKGSPKYTKALPRTPPPDSPEPRPPRSPALIAAPAPTHSRMSSGDAGVAAPLLARTHTGRVSQRSRHSESPSRHDRPHHVRTLSSSSSGSSSGSVHSGEFGTHAHGGTGATAGMRTAAGAEAPQMPWGDIRLVSPPRSTSVRHSHSYGLPLSPSHQHTQTPHRHSHHGYTSPDARTFELALGSMARSASTRSAAHERERGRLS
ncbi:acid protease [Laetiporus sulphureus 93-53]|uniref:Acid protease n=1 Tax=Laetiporus sulphureus 93-53 TaxID=1314785 RepID=A0A165HXA4_9APHY|nr:acid protease [Laetiporus sulphureus 93-53]KZT12311.1 acid protease [Laetiporus sulphureus 93-53]